MPPPSPDLVLLVEAALPHVGFDGWSDATIAAAARDIGMDDRRVAQLLPRGGVDLAVASHRMGDAEMARLVAMTGMSGMRYRDRVATALRLRIAACPDREVLRRSAALFALPHLVPTGAALIWGTADAIWQALGDTSRDGAWYTKRATLSAVWAAVLLYWLGDDTPDAQATSDFIDRRIGDVMWIEGAKARINATAPLRPLTAPLARLMAGLRMPGDRDDLPGRWTEPEPDA